MTVTKNVNDSSEDADSLDTHSAEVYKQDPLQQDHLTRKQDTLPTGLQVFDV